MQRKLFYAIENLAADNFAKTGSDSGAKESADDRADGASDRHQQHQAAGSPDISDISLHNPVIHNICHQGWQIQVSKGLRKGEHQYKNERHTIRFHESHQLDHASSSPFHSE